MDTNSRSFTLIPNQKYRRSCRKNSSQPNTSAEHVTSNGPAVGYFEILPSEMFYKILQHLSVKDISVLCMVSKDLSAQLVNYIVSSPGSKRLLLKEFHCTESTDKNAQHCIVEHYKSLGFLFKRCTLLLPTKERLRFIHRKFSEVTGDQQSHAHSDSLLSQLNWILML
ncbi:F-box only protein 47-like [Protopterus annectens]|uniref:F-box only protein 47-like n=1 Tax=Protopterus annectens TaxID=7888 RepID=UPI001CF937FB|nr:F-box only protein 47-like [Protopterus annectens]